MLTELVFQGTPAQIGAQHGESLRDQIRKTFEIYLSVWDVSSSLISSKVKGFKAAVKKYFPAADEEITGIASGAALSEDVIYAINARTELLARRSISECTSAGINSRVQADGDVVLGQNWDWINDLRGLTRVVEVNPDGKRRMKMLIEPGLIGKMGLNDAGVGVCLNFLFTQFANYDAVPVHVLLRSLLECSSCIEAAQLLQKTPRAASANYLIGDSNYDIVCNFEATPDSVVASSPMNAIATHTNTYYLRGEACARKRLFESVLSQHEKISPDNFKEALRRVEACAAPRNGIETIHAMLMNLTKKYMAVSEGCASGEFAQYVFH